MNINNKIISFLVFSFLLISVIFTFNSINTLKKNQEDNIKLFKKEFLELGRELFEKNSDIFFNVLDSQYNVKNSDITLSEYIAKTHPSERDIVVVDLSTRKIVGGYEGTDISSLFNQSNIDSYIEQNILNQKTDFDLDNFNEFELDTTNTIIPSKLHFHIYNNSGVMVGFGQKFTTGKVRIEFIERQNDILYKSQIYSSITLFVITLIVIIIFMALVMKMIIVKPLDKIISVVKLITAGDLNRRVDIVSRDEIGQLGLAFNEMTGKLQELYYGMDNKVKEKTIELSVKVKELDDQNKSILSILKEIEEAKKYSDKLAKDLEKFKLAVDNASDQIVITDSDGIVVYGNTAVEKITGYTAEEALGKKAGALWKMPMSEDYYKNMWSTIKLNKKPYIGEIQNKRKNGEIYTAYISISLVFDDNKNVVYYVAIERDITKDKDVDRAKSEFVSLASHQLRTPLSAISWYTEMLLDGDAGPINEEQKSFLEQTAGGIKRMVDLVNDLLNVSRLDMGTFILEAKPISITTLLKSAFEENRQQLIEKKLVIQETYGEDINEFMADEKLMRMIFQNILSNAVKYTNLYGVLKVSLLKYKIGDRVDDRILDEDSLVFSVSDSGVGIPSNEQDKIFTKLFRAGNVKESGTEGTGLGLYVIKSIVDLSGGQIWFKSEENVGTTFYVVFPMSGMKEKKIKSLV